MSNMSKVEDMEGKSASFRNDAELFKDNAQDLEKAAYWRAMKMRILIGVISCVVISLILYALF